MKRRRGEMNRKSRKKLRLYPVFDLLLQRDFAHSKAAARRTVTHTCFHGHKTDRRWSCATGWVSSLVTITEGGRVWWLAEYRYGTLNTLDTIEQFSQHTLCSNSDGTTSFYPASAPSKRMHMLPMCGRYLYYALVATCVFPCSSIWRQNERCRERWRQSEARGLPKTAARPVKEPKGHESD